MYVARKSTLVGTGTLCYVPGMSYRVRKIVFGISDWILSRVPRERLLRPLREALKVQAPLQVLFVCNGNICRSAYAHALVEKLAKERGLNIAVDSAGLYTTPGKPADARASEVSYERGVSLERHRTKSLSKELVETAHVIMVMEVLQFGRVVSRFPRAKNKVMLLGILQPASDGSTMIEDPYGCPREQYKESFARIDGAVEALLKLIHSSGK